MHLHLHIHGSMFLGEQDTIKWNLKIVKMKSRKYIHTYSSNYIIEIFPPGLVLQSDQPIRTYVIYKYIIYKICSSDRWALNT